VKDYERFVGAGAEAGRLFNRTHVGPNQNLKREKCLGVLSPQRV